MGNKRTINDLWRCEREKFRSDKSIRMTHMVTQWQVNISRNRTSAGFAVCAADVLFDPSLTKTSKMATRSNHLQDDRDAHDLVESLELAIRQITGFLSRFGMVCPMLNDQEGQAFIPFSQSNTLVQIWQQCLRT